MAVPRLELEDTMLKKNDILSTLAEMLREAGADKKTVLLLAVQLRNPEDSARMITWLEEHRKATLLEICTAADEITG